MSVLCSAWKDSGLKHAHVVDGRQSTRGAHRDWIDLLFTAFRRVIDQQIDGNVTK